MSTRHQRLALARSLSPQGQKPRRQTPAYLLFVNRPLGAVLARHAFSVRVTPDQLTFAGAALAALALAALLAAATWPVAAVAGAVLLLVAYVFDSADGQLARLYGGGSAAGEWLDHVVDIAKTTAVHVVAVAVVLQHPDTVATGWVAVPLAFLVVSATSFFSLTLRDQLLARREDTVAPAPFRLARAFTGLPNDHGVLCIVLATAGWPVVFLAVYAALGAVSAALLVRSLRHSHAALAAPATAPPVTTPVLSLVPHTSTRETRP